jgi:hypothetical protein
MAVVVEQSIVEQIAKALEQLLEVQKQTNVLLTEIRDQLHEADVFIR